VKKPVCIPDKNAVRVTQIQAGNIVHLYDLMGNLLFQSIAESDEMIVPLTSKIGIIKVSDQKSSYTIKVVAL